MNMLKKGLKNPTIYLLIIVLIIQLISIISVDFRKESFHIDEIYSYILSNSYDTDRIANDPNAWGQWLEGEYFKKFVSVQDNETFAYGKVNRNNSADAHPPLYYFLLHTICSILPNTFTKWIGLGINCVFFIGIQILLFILMKKISKSNLCGITCVAIYGGMFAALDMLIFIRMYTLLTFFAILLTYLHYQLYIEQDKKILYVLCGVITFLGIYTQYYFAFYACSLAIVMCTIFLKNKKYKKLITYSTLMLLAVIMVFVVYPAAITQITGSETNNVGKEVAGNIFNFSTLPVSIFNLLLQIIKGIFLNFYKIMWLLTLCIVLTIIISGLLNKKNVKDVSIKKELLIIIPTIIALIVVTVSHVSGKFIYLRYVYYIYPLISIFIVLCITYIAKKLELNLKVITVGFSCIGLIGTIIFATMNTSTYLFREKNHIKEICYDRPLILMNNGETYHPTSNFEILLNSSQVYLYDVNKQEDIDEILSHVNIEKGIIIIVLTDKYWSNGYDGDALLEKIVENSSTLTIYEGIGFCEFSNVYIAK